MAATFRPAQRKNLNVRLALCGPTGSGKTFTALGVGVTLADGGRVAVIDTERSSADRYADKFQFDACPLEHYSPEAYIEAIEAAAAGKYSVLVIDSLSHAWDGAEGLLERVDAIAKRSASKNSFNAWGEATPLHRRLIDTILSFPGHVIVTMRSKMEYIIETNDRGKQVPRKVGMAPVQRQGVEYEFDIVGDMDQEHNLVITKSRAFELADRVINRPGQKFAVEILTWAKGGVQTTPKAEATKTDPSKADVPPIDPPTKPLKFESDPSLDTMKWFVCAACGEVTASNTKVDGCRKCGSKQITGGCSEGAARKAAQNVADRIAAEKAKAEKAETPAQAQEPDVSRAKKQAVEAEQIRRLVNLVFKPKNREQMFNEFSKLCGRLIVNASDFNDEKERAELIEFLEVIKDAPEADREALLNTWYSNIQAEKGQEVAA